MFVATPAELFPTVAVIAALAAGVVFSDEIVQRQAFGGGRVGEAVLTPFGFALVGGFGLAAFYPGIELARAAAANQAARTPLAAYCLFSATLFHDIAVGANLIDADGVVR